MDRSNTVNLVFGGVLLLTGAVIIGMCQYKNWSVFLKWLTFLGLIIDAFGALALVLSELWPIQAFLWPGMVAAKNQIEKAKSDSEISSHNAFLKQGDDGFEELVTITRSHRTIPNSERDYPNVEIEEFCFWPNGDIYANGIHVYQETLSSPEEVQVWILDRITTLTRDKVYPYAALTLFAGFGLQIISYWLQNL